MFQRLDGYLHHVSIRLIPRVGQPQNLPGVPSGEPGGRRIGWLQHLLHLGRQAQQSQLLCDVTLCLADAPGDLRLRGRRRPASW